MRKFKTTRFRRGPLPFRHVLLISAVIFVVLALQGIWLVNKSIEPTLMTYAQTQTKRLANVIITKAINEQMEVGSSNAPMFTTRMDNQGKVSTIEFSADAVNRTQNAITKAVERYLHMAERGEIDKLGIRGEPKINLAKSLEDEGILFAVPLGQVTKNALLGNLGPKIPVTFTTIGDVKTSIKREAKTYGINNALVEVVVEVEVSMQVIIPFETKETVVKTDIPIALSAIQGEVPDYYNGGQNGAVPALPPAKKER
ncbi:sporulation protein YunB [Ectobacillus antri]|uniref:Sporulation protein YunB n=1 Tax=Ectobacillus antri TaxID=2486280 RepID=A0ABT6H773_9BACI|nr:sporulation protein YunB [Ectobacillus antri]MDG4657090.1 sporulation protein YunB [Ectobacillus antri]MDG5754549.1 sporulation protein YunB [Ectobacillus antri]